MSYPPKKPTMSYNALPILFVIVVLLVACHPRRRPFVDPVIPATTSEQRSAKVAKWRDSTWHTRAPDLLQADDPAARTAVCSKGDSENLTPS